ncbi:altronate oxidoreductase [Enterocloster clostridioformis]|uniref:tagaturonate reductase n=1 Tax=Enterocloster clostridioformis TaxID=1531 RepID=UPI00080CA6E5|nr:tagaturonate reductase [Enterocloster clostridioformis]ANU48342.1 altronate oxidoreductase [Lachnoclostridium sp. YL32]NDO29408.1 tagaturonate reductase [Enterocloster clostridioformis]OXE68951.1 altronate oxidoreductase [Enterocloster clostridioformis]QQR02767.1 tagaturonate reductase [Enterocloster clostridioformis]
MARKETVIQFGEGRFLRGFADYFFQKLQDKGLFDGSVVIVQPIEKGMCSVLEQQGCEYNLFLRGIDNGQVVDEHIHIDIISRCVNPYENFESYMKLAENPDFRFIVSNTTEAGIEYVDSNQFTDAPARSFPGKLTQLLYKRFRLGLKGFIILSCELIDHNGEELEKCCLRYADLWGLGEEFKTWLVQENDFCSTLVDRIVTGFPRDEHEELCRRIGEQDNMMDTAEIFHLWVIQGSHEDELPLQKAGFHVVWTDNVDPYKKRKVRILNGAHTSMVLGAHLYGLKTVGECLKDEKVSALLRKCIFGEIIPAIGDTEDNRKFGEAVLERFSNPFIKHMLLSIALNSVSKFRARVLPAILEYRDMFGSCPQGLTFSLAALIAFYRTDDANDSQEIMDFMKTAPVEDILKREDYWGQDLSPLLADVRKWYDLIEAEGMDKAYRAVLK